MALIIKQISVDVASENIFQSIIAKQYDTDSRFLKVKLTNEGSQILVLPASTVLINARREDGNAKAFAGTVNEDGTVTVPITNWMLELDGQVKCDISVIDKDKRKLSSTSFQITVEEAAYTGEEIYKDEDYDVLMELMLECERATNAAERVGITTTEALETAYANILKGRNRLHRTNQGTTNWSFHSFYNESDHTLEAVTTEDGTHAVKLTIRSTSEEWSVLAYSLRDTLDKLEPHTKYTLSFDMQTNVDHSYYINICTVGSKGQLVTETFYGVPVGNQGWEHFVWHLTTNDLAALNEDYADDIVLYFGVREGTGYRTIKNLKLEKGSTDTEWCKSPEDCIHGTALTEITASAFDGVEQSVLDNREEWITIADTTLKEEVASLQITTDIDGNPFECKKIVAKIKYKHGTPIPTSPSFSVYISGTHFWQNMPVADTYEITLFIHAEKGKFMSVDVYYQGAAGDGEVNYWGHKSSNSPHFLFTGDVNNVTGMSYYPPANSTVPTGSQIKIWGLKA